MTLAALAETSALHPNTVREHLDTLVRAGLATRTRVQPHGRGRPAWAYEATSAVSEASEYAALAVVLSSTIARTSPQPSVDAALAGEDWGRNLARDRGAAPTTPSWRATVPWSCSTTWASSPARTRVPRQWSA